MGKREQASGNPNWMIADVQFIVKVAGCHAWDKFCEHLLCSLMAAA